MSSTDISSGLAILSLTDSQPILLTKVVPI